MVNVTVMIDRLASLRKQAEDLIAARPHLLLRRTYVGCSGPFGAPLLVIGEAPGEVEETERRPFCGAAGQLLAQSLESVGLGPGWYMLTNVVKFRPATNPGTILGTQHGNRKPNQEEMHVHTPLLMEEIEVLQPRVIIAAGATPASLFFPSEDFRITRDRGRVVYHGHIPVLPIYHPSYLLHRNQDRKGPLYETFLSDLRLAKTLI